jgi:hypothetical protein
MCQPASGTEDATAEREQESNKPVRLWGRCTECKTIFDLGTPPPGIDLSKLPCQAVWGFVGNKDRPFVIPGGPTGSIINTAQGITPIRPCNGTLEVRTTRNFPEEGEPVYVELPLDYSQIPLADAEKFLRDMHPWILEEFDLRVEFAFPEADGWLTRPHFAGGPSIKVRLLVREDQFDKAKQAFAESSEAQAAEG